MTQTPDPYAWWLVKKSRVGLSTNDNENQNQLRLARAIFPALWASYREIATNLDWFITLFALLWLVEVITLVFVLRHSNENRSKICPWIQEIFFADGNLSHSAVEICRIFFSVVIRARCIIFVVSSSFLFSNHIPHLESYRVSYLVCGACAVWTKR